jgi:hypothetical protein
VYDGSRARWREDDSAAPLNAYGRTKLAGERAVAARWPNHAILRSSIIYGPEPPVPVSRPLFLQFVDAQLAAGVRPSGLCFFFVPPLALLRALPPTVDRCLPCRATAVLAAATIAAGWAVRSVVPAVAVSSLPAAAACWPCPPAYPPTHPAAHE